VVLRAAPFKRFLRTEHEQFCGNFVLFNKERNTLPLGAINEGSFAVGFCSGLDFCVVKSRHVEWRNNFSFYLGSMRDHTPTGREYQDSNVWRGGSQAPREWIFKVIHYPRRYRRMLKTNPSF